MPVATLDEVKRLADHLAPLDQARLVEYLASRIAQTVATAQALAPADSTADQDAWREFFRLGEAVASQDSPDASTLTAAVLSMRR